ncbi:MAG: Hsp70 family protein [Gemmataceae bacterium]|nr:Hsp70 family protein [Gemmataceae bacterium]
MADIIVGIDLGTTNSEIAVLRDGKPVVLEEDGDPILPSFVGLGEDGKLLVGRAARNQYALAPERTIKSIKRKMGQDATVTLGEQTYRPQEISALILKTLKDRASAQLGVPITKAVITVPAFFNDAQRQATKEAGEIAGLEVVRILNEPTAASLTYDPTHEHMQRILVYDLGGGTFDVSIVQAQQGVIEVLASHGDTQLGGDDFDELLLNHVLRLFQQEHGIDLSAQAVPRARLLRAVEAAKRQLSFEPFVRLEEEFIAEKDGRPLHLSMELSRRDYEALIQPLLDRTLASVQRALQDCNLMPRDLDRVVLVGGATRTPLVSEMLEARIGQPAHQEVNPDLCVAMGAAIQGALIAGENVGAVLVDITPHSLGINTLGERDGFTTPYCFSPIIKRNTPLPSNRSEVFTTSSDNQQIVEIKVYQGENDDVRNNHQLGSFLVEGLARVSRGNQVVVQFDLDLNGILKVSAKEKMSGLQKQITIRNALHVPSIEEVSAARDRLAELFAGMEELNGENGEDGDEEEASGPPELVPGPREGQRETVQARALIEKAERLIPTMQPEDKAEVERLIGQLRQALDERAWQRLGELSNNLSDVLFYLEDA